MTAYEAEMLTPAGENQGGTAGVVKLVLSSLMWDESFLVNLPVIEWSVLSDEAISKQHWRQWFT